MNVIAPVFAYPVSAKVEEFTAKVMMELVRKERSRHREIIPAYAFGNDGNNGGRPLSKEAAARRRVVVKMRKDGMTIAAISRQLDQPYTRIQTDLRSLRKAGVSV